MTYLRYRADIETPQADEAQAIQDIIKAMRQQSVMVAKRENHAVRASHAKSTGLLTGELIIDDDLPEALAQGLFARGGTYKVALRLSQGAGEILPDSVSVHRGLAIKVFGVPGDKLAGHDADAQDFVLASGPVFPAGTAQGFRADEKQLAAATLMPSGLKSAVSSAARNANRALAVTGRSSAKADFFGHPFTHPLAEPYFSQAPIRYGDYVAKIAAFPRSANLWALAKDTIDTRKDDNAFRHAVVNFFQTQGAEWAIRVQLWTDAITQPIEDASVEWPQQETPYQDVATLKIPSQDAYSPARQRYFDDVMTFRPAHSLVAHRPLGSVMRARLAVYEALSNFRHQENGITPENPDDFTRIPV